MSTTLDRAQTQMSPKPDSLRSTRAGAIWTALPAHDQELMLCLLAGEIVRTFGDLMSTVDSGRSRPDRLLLGRWTKS